MKSAANLVPASHSNRSLPRCHAGVASHRAQRHAGQEAEPQATRQTSEESSASFEVSGLRGGVGPPESLTTLQLAKDVWPAAAALGVSVGCATLVFPFFTYVPSSGWLQAMLPQVRPLCLTTYNFKLQSSGTVGPATLCCEHTLSNNSRRARVEGTRQTISMRPAESGKAVYLL